MAAGAKRLSDWIGVPHTSISAITATVAAASKGKNMRRYHETTLMNIHEHP
ncbi:hypothetical protein [Streptomyces sp. GESEQ-35]|uniref:hypothetical protein n=1 Tax=Streptomyces sp. GESEQ-35 TaxID=2812657 RepID=UPI001B342D80|nr:hypothetical protein [Streptomyces sp. GESEQ-35]